MSEWRKIIPPQCDGCGRRAIWQHPAGGLRCGRCPKEWDGSVASGSSVGRQFGFLPDSGQPSTNTVGVEGEVQE
jgi:hypothetical protein